MAVQRMVREEPTPYWIGVGRFVRSVFSPLGLLWLASVACMIFLIGWLPIIGPILAGGLFASYFFLVIQESSRGRETLPSPGRFSEMLGEVVFAWVRFGLATLVLWVPALVYLKMTGGLMRVWTDPGGTLADPVLMLIVALGVAYLPGAMIIAAIGDAVFSALNPLYVLTFIRRVPGQYLATVAIFCLLSVAQMMVVAAITFVGSVIPDPIFTPILMGALRLTVPLTIAFVLGRFIYQNKEAFGLEPEGEVLVPAMPDAIPRGKVASKATLSGTSVEAPPAAAAPSIEAYLAPEPPRSEIPPPTPARPSFDREESLDSGSNSSGSWGAGRSWDSVPPLPTGYTGTVEPAMQLEIALDANDPPRALEAYDRLRHGGRAPAMQARLELKLAGYLAEDER